MAENNANTEKDNRTLMQRLIDAGYPEEEMDHHESDLYVYVNDISTPVLKAYFKEHGWEITHHAPKFINQITGKPMYDCVFQYDPFWEGNQD